GAVGDAHELAPLAAGEPEAVLEVDGAVRVVGPLVVRDVEAPQVARVDAQVHEPVPTVLDPAVEPRDRLVGLGEELDLHLLELAGAEDEVAGRDLVAERLTDLTDADRWLTPGGGHDVLVVDEDALRGLRAQVVQARLVVDRAEEGL